MEGIAERLQAECGGEAPHSTLLAPGASHEVQALLGRLAQVSQVSHASHASHASHVSHVSHVSNIEAEIAALLDDPNWRFHLTAAAALLLRGSSPSTLAALWTRIELGSRVVAQLAATARRLDPRFAERAKAWIEAHYRLPVPPRGGVSGIWNVFPNQTAAALLALLGELPGEAAWVAEWRERPAVAAALADGTEDGRTALSWGERMAAEIEQFRAI